MRCNPSLWLLGLIPIALLSWIAVHFEHEGIERDLTHRAQAALHRTGLDWATAHFSGRDGVVTGRAVQERDPSLALASVRDVWGVRMVRNRSELVQRVDKFIWSAKSDGKGRLTLSGYVPSEDARKALVKTARTAFPKTTIADDMHLARGAIDRDRWLQGAAFSLKVLAGLKAGDAELSALDLSMAGAAATSEAYRRTRAALAKQRPAGIKLVRETIALPMARPFVWSAKKTGDQVSIAGFAPSDDDRGKVNARAKAVFAKATVSDSSDIADGAPDGWGKAVSVVLEQLALLKGGEAQLHDRELTFTGEAADEQAAGAVRRTLKLDVPQNFKISDQIRYPRPDRPGPGAGYVMGIVNGGNAIEIIGMVPSEAARVALIDAVKGRFPGRSVADKTQVAPGAPDGWQQCVVAGLASLARLTNGRSVLTNRKLDVSGETDDYAASQSVPGDVKAAAGQTCEATTNIKFTGQMKTDLTWSVAREANGMVTLRGEAPDEPSRARLMEIAQQIYAGSSVTDMMKIVGATPEPWLSATHIGLEQLARLQRGDVSLSGKELTIKGAADSEQVANDIRSVLATDLPPGFKGNDAITVMTVQEKAADSCQTLMRTTARGTINFERAKADLLPESTQTLKDLAEIANECPSFSIQIEGHTDAEGTDERNQRLSDRRAQVVADFLAQNGVDAKRLTTVGYGATKPIADNATETGRAKNRRIEFTVKAN
jgi:outer membrane protein OmpA-like peptidoglycan-associated protein/osmotically-inducible protein OsmY